MPSSAPTAAHIGRRLRAVPIRGLITGDGVKAVMAAQQKNLDNNDDNDNNRDESGVSVLSVASQRMLQEGANQSDFGLQVRLQGINGESTMVIPPIRAAVVVDLRRWLLP
jgi:hypothetical protein